MFASLAAGQRESSVRQAAGTDLGASGAGACLARENCLMPDERTFHALPIYLAKRLGGQVVCRYAAYATVHAQEKVEECA